MTSSEPGATTFLPSVVGTLPISTKPLLSTASAVVRPRLLPWKNVTGSLLDTSLTIVAPVPCRFDFALKFDTTTSPGLSMLQDGTPGGTNAMPYGLKSPLAGTVGEVTDCGGKIASCASAPTVPQQL
ncbi:hypothetical protein [Paraburkholderia sp. 31.1]|uniref:hypothetical protein n=1 Tax=Paraburkholderia sp. 31.1 TaxID=2615205 RepID=UPI001655876D|nr:hypothetical protein [Paraburkholderia sp. 31.1]